MSLAQINPFDYFSDTNGDPLDQGYIYVGAANQDPVTNPIAIYYDAEMTIPAPQPLRTVAGYISNPIAPQTFFTNQNYSVSVRDKNQVVLFYVANFSSIVSNTPFALQLAASNAWIAAFQAYTQAWGDNFIATNDAWAANYRATNEAWAAAFQANLIQRYLSFNNRGNWATGTGYAIQDLVIQGSIAYICLIAHTSGVFATDLANGDWAIYQGATKSELASTAGASLIGFLQAGAGTILRTLQSKGRDAVSLTDYSGADPTGITDSSTAIVSATTAATGLTVPAGTYKVSQYGAPAAINIQTRGLGAAILQYTYSSGKPIAWANFKTNTITENLQYICATPFTSPISGLRASIELASNVTIRNCHFEGFNPNSINNPLTDGWGLYIKDAHNCTVDNSSWANNGQSDIAFLDRVTNVTIINPVSTSHSGITLNVEPNSLGASTNGTVGANFIGGSYLNITLLEAENFVYASRDLRFIGAQITNLNWYGSGSSFEGCNIANLIPILSAGTTFAGQLRISNANLSNNLVADPFLGLVSSGAPSAWGTASTGGTLVRTNDPTDGIYLTFNANNTSGTFTAFNRTKVPVVAGELLVAAIRSRSNNQTSTGLHILNLSIYWFTSGGSLISTTSVRCARTLLNTSSGWCNDVAIVNPPATATQAQFYIGKTSSGTSSVDVAAVGLFRPTLNVGQGNWNETLDRLFLPVVPKDVYSTGIPTGVTGGHFVGERIVNSAPAIGQPKAWTCSVAGDPGTWISEGNF